MVVAVLMVDDDPTFGSEIDRAFRERGLDIHIGSSLAAADALLASFDYSVVLLDLLLPDGHGLTLLDSLRREGWKKAVVVVSKHLPDYARALLNYYPEVKLVFSKPLNADTLAETVRALATNRE